MRNYVWALLSLSLVPQALASDTLSTSGYQMCLADSDIKVNALDVTYSRSSREVVFDVAGTNTKEQNVIASLTVTAYGNEIYNKEFDPCGHEIHVAKLCPGAHCCPCPEKIEITTNAISSVPSGTFSAQGAINVPETYASQIPAIAFNIPDLQGYARLTLKSKDTEEEVSCVESELSNGNSANIKGVAWVSAGIAAGAFALSGLSALGAAGHPGAHPSSPGFGDVMGWFHSMATNGMLSVSYPTVYRSFTRNFAWSTGLIPLAGMQHSIDNFRNATGGNLTHESYVYLTSLQRPSSVNPSSKRGLDLMVRAAELLPRSMEMSHSNSTNSSASSGGDSSSVFSESGFKSFVEEAMIPSANVFMTVLLIFAIVVAVVVVGILLVKVILEIWAVYGNFPKKLSTFRKDYWGLMARTITNMILVLYSIWVLYCVYQLRNGDSWAAKLLAAVTLTVFTSVLAFFAWRIFYMARKYKKAEGDTASLFDNKETWRKYSLFYDVYKKDFWWLFVPVIFYALAKGCIIAGAQGHGMAQSAGQLVVEALLLILLAWNRPYVTKSSMWINITIQVVRVLSVACVLVFVEELGVSQTTKTVTGIALIAIQSTLTGVLAILIAVNAIIFFIRENPHAKRRKEAGMFLSSIISLHLLLILDLQKKQTETSTTSHLSMRESLF